MGAKEDYGARILAAACGAQFSRTNSLRSFMWGTNAGEARVDGVIGDNVAVEIESRVNKQVRGALLDLVCHPLPLKLLLLVPGHAGNPRTSLAQAEAILGRFISTQSFRVVQLDPTNDDAESINLVKVAVHALLSRTRV